jgi:hypothetical protein
MTVNKGKYCPCGIAGNYPRLLVIDPISGLSNIRSKGNARGGRTFRRQITETSMDNMKMMGPDEILHCGSEQAVRQGFSVLVFGKREW